MESPVGDLGARPGVVCITALLKPWEGLGLGSNHRKGNRNCLLHVQEEGRKQVFLFSTHALSVRGLNLFCVCPPLFSIKWYMLLFSR